LQASRKKRLISWMLKDIISDKLFRAVFAGIQESEFEDLIDKVYRREVDPYTAADKIIGRSERNRINSGGSKS
jgi:putative protein kinase ArgK-like GTPase of G3E family